MERYSKNYVFTVDPKNELELDKLRIFKENVKLLNKDLKFGGSTVRYKIAVRGRLRKNNPAAKKYAKDGCWVGKKWSRMIDLKDAVRWDVYLYREVR